MDRNLRTNIQNFLLSLPSIHSMGSQQSLVHSAGLDQNLQNQIQFNASADAFVSSLVSICEQYGSLSDGRNPFVAIIEAACHSVGPDRQKQGALIIEQILGQPYTPPVQPEKQQESQPVIVQGGQVELTLLLHNEDLQAFLDVLKDSHAEDYIQKCFVKREVVL